MTVDGCDHTPDHIHADRPACHIGDASERHIIDKQDVQIRFTFGLTLFLDICENSVNQTAKSALCIVELADRIIHAQLSRPGIVRDRIP